MATDTTPHQQIRHHSQLSVFVKRKLFSTTATGVEVHSENGRLLQEIPYHTITKLWGYDGLSAEDSKGDLFRIRYTRVYSSRTGPVFISNTSHMGSSGRKYTPAASNQNESYDLLMKEIISQVTRIHPPTRLYTGFRAVVVISLVNIMIGIAFMLFPFFEFQMGTRASVSAWLEYLGLSVMIAGMDLWLVLFAIVYIRSYWPKSTTIDSITPRP